MLGIKSTADVSAYPAFYSFVQQSCPSVASGIVDVEAWLKEPALAADISWTAWRRYLGKPHRWMLDSAMKQLRSITSAVPSSPLSPSSPSSTPLSLSSSSSDATDASSPPPLPLASSGTDSNMDEEQALSFDWEIQSDIVDMQKTGTRRQTAKASLECLHDRLRPLAGCGHDEVIAALDEGAPSPDQRHLEQPLVPSGRAQRRCSCRTDQRRGGRRHFASCCRR